jgi:hypothetical protein
VKIKRKDGILTQRQISVKSSPVARRMETIFQESHPANLHVLQKVNVSLI